MVLRVESDDDFQRLTPAQRDAYLRGDDVPDGEAEGEVADEAAAEPATEEAPEGEAEEGEPEAEPEANAEADVPKWERGAYKEERERRKKAEEDNRLLKERLAALEEDNRMVKGLIARATTSPPPPEKPATRAAETAEDDAPDPDLDPRGYVRHHEKRVEKLIEERSKPILDDLRSVKAWREQQEIERQVAAEEAELTASNPDYPEAKAAFLERATRNPNRYNWDALTVDDILDEGRAILQARGAGANKDAVVESKKAAHAARPSPKAPPHPPLPSGASRGSKRQAGYKPFDTLSQDDWDALPENTRRAYINGEIE